ETGSDRGWRAVVSAGDVQEVCGLVVTLAGNTPAVGAGLWSKFSGPGTVTFSDATVHNATATASAAGVYVLRWTISNGVCPSSSEDRKSVVEGKRDAVAGG